MIRWGVLFAIVLMGSGCSTWRTMPLTGCNHPSGWCDQIRAEARGAWLYAQLSNNAYGDGPYFALPPTVVETDRAADGNYAWALFERRDSAGTVLERILAFRGTDGWGDFPSGGLTGAQQRDALATFDLVDRLLPDAPTTLTGHSLGGALATHVSLNRANAPAWVFNTSPVFRAEGDLFANPRHSLTEQGDILKILRAPGPEPTQLYTKMNCRRAGPIGNHRILAFATCITQAAAWDESSTGATLQIRLLPPPR